MVCFRILDNLPLVVPIRRQDQESATIYQQGFHVGLKGQYTGVNTNNYNFLNELPFLDLGGFWILHYIATAYASVVMLNIWNFGHHPHNP